MAETYTLEMLRSLIKEVKNEKKTLKEGKESQPETKKETLNEYVTKNLMELIRESGD